MDADEFLSRLDKEIHIVLVPLHRERVARKTQFEEAKLALDRAEGDWDAAISKIKRIVALRVAAIDSPEQPIKMAPASDAEQADQPADLLDHSAMSYVVCNCMPSRSVHFDPSRHAPDCPYRKDAESHALIAK